MQKKFKQTSLLAGFMSQKCIYELNCGGQSNHTSYSTKSIAACRKICSTTM